MLREFGDVRLGADLHARGDELRDQGRGGGRQEQRSGGEDEGEEGAQPHDASGPGRPIVARGRLMRGC